jgi:hypothetical protein
MPNPSVFYVSELLPVDVAEAEPPKPVESTHSKPRRVAMFDVTYTLYRFGGWVHDVATIPMSIRGSKNVQKSRTNSGMRGQAALAGSAAIMRIIPSSYSDRMTS